MTKYEIFLASIDKNASKPCARCGEKPRHVTKTGKVFTALCTDCLRSKKKLENL